MWSPLGEGSHARHQSQLKPFTLHIGHRVASPFAGEGQGEGACGRVGGTAGARVITGYPDLPPLPDGQAILQLVSQCDQASRCAFVARTTPDRRSCSWSPSVTL